jgi:hypothetical protein
MSTESAVERQPPRWRARHRCHRPMNRDTAGAPPPPIPDEVLEPTLETAAGEVPSSPADQSSRPLCVIARSSSIDRAEVDLRRALLVTMGGNRPVLTPRQVLEVVAANFGIDASSMDIMAAAPEDFLLVLPDSRAADRVLQPWVASA